MVTHPYRALRLDTCFKQHGGVAKTRAKREELAQVSKTLERRANFSRSCISAGRLCDVFVFLLQKGQRSSNDLVEKSASENQPTHRKIHTFRLLMRKNISKHNVQEQSTGVDVDNSKNHMQDWTCPKKMPCQCTGARNDMGELC